MVTVGLWVRLEARPGREDDLEAFLRSAAPLVAAEPETVAWFGVRLSATTFGIFDAFPDEAGRRAHLAGRVAAALGEHGPALLSTAPVLEQVDVLAAKLPA
jgi:quinol monooxygenase YgiN